MADKNIDDRNERTQKLGADETLKREDVEKHPLIHDEEIQYHTVAIPPGGLRELARIHLGDPERWDEIHVHNIDILPNPDVHTHGQVVRVPANLKRGKKEKKEDR